MFCRGFGIPKKGQTQHRRTLAGMKQLLPLVFALITSTANAHTLIEFGPGYSAGHRLDLNTGKPTGGPSFRAAFARQGQGWEYGAQITAAHVVTEQQYTVQTGPATYAVVTSRFAYGSPMIIPTIYAAARLKVSRNADVLAGIHAGASYITKTNDKAGHYKELPGGTQYPTETTTGYRSTWGQAAGIQSGVRVKEGDRIAAYLTAWGTYVRTNIRTNSPTDKGGKAAFLTYGVALNISFRL